MKTLPFKIRAGLGLLSLALSHIILFHIYFIQIEYKFRTVELSGWKESVIFIFGISHSELNEYYK